jgi:hypothetical protein
VADTYGLVRKMIGRLARAMGERLDRDLSAECTELVATKTKPDIDWQDPTVRQGHLRDLVDLAAEMVATAAMSEGVADSEVAEAARLLAEVVIQDVTDTGIEAEIADGVARDRIVSHSDPEMRHGRKSASRRFDGHKLDLIIDEDSELVLGVEVRAGNAGDGDGAAALVAKAHSLDGVEVVTLLGDMAYSNGDVREAVEAHGAEMVAKVPPVTNAGRFPKTDFTVEVGAGTVMCPAGHTTSDSRKVKDHKGRRAVAYRFDADTCAAWPLRDQCTTGNGGRQIMVGRHHDRIEKARAARADPDTKALLRRRAKVERKIDHLQDLGMRKARFRGRRKTQLQALLAATVVNFKRLVVLTRSKEPPPPPPKTRKNHAQSDSSSQSALSRHIRPQWHRTTIGALQRVGLPHHGKPPKQALAAHSPSEVRPSMPAQVPCRPVWWQGRPAEFPCGTSSRRKWRRPTCP